MLNYEEMKIQKGFLLVCAVVLGIAVSLLLKTIIEQKDVSVVQNLVSTPPATTSENVWKTYVSNSFSFKYPSDVLFASVESGDNVFLTKPANIDSPLALPSDGIWVEATVYSATAKTGLLEEVTALTAASVGTVAVHPITPYPGKFIKENNIYPNGVMIVSASIDSGEMASALWIKNNKVYQLRIVVEKRGVYENFKPTFEKIVNTFQVTD